MHANTMSEPISPYFSVVIATCHRNAELAKCLQCLAPSFQTVDASRYEVIVSDDGSTSTAEDMVRESFPWAKWTRGPRRGPAANRNHGAASAVGEWLVFLDDDCIPEPGWLEAYAAQCANADVLEGRTSPCGVRDRADMECPANETGGYLWSCNMAIRSEVFRQMGGFDESFPFAAFEDMDLHFRLLDANKVVKFVLEARVLHPWRIAKGADFLRARAKSGERLRAKHPTRVPPWGISKKAEITVRFLIKKWIPQLVRFSGRGSFRSLQLHFVSMELGC
jgi:GT2 family glycosyltransferase